MRASSQGFQQMREARSRNKESTKGTELGNGREHYSEGLLINIYGYGTFHLPFEFTDVFYYNSLLAVAVAGLAVAWCIYN
mmetsp:Transcript_12037/g.20454  ORF Transcript_12037/g.20454 Transcript_12037/m.20454 type:complete len:80 (-) Transcript_12037:2-241(-)